MSRVTRALMCKMRRARGRPHSHFTRERSWENSRRVLRDTVRLAEILDPLLDHVRAVPRGVEDYPHDVALHVQVQSQGAFPVDVLADAAVVTIFDRLPLLLGAHPVDL